jgi:GH24 family phage-related lysozyme (muramidase)
MKRTSLAEGFGAVESFGFELELQLDLGALDAEREGGGGDGVDPQPELGDAGGADWVRFFAAASGTEAKSTREQIVADLLAHEGDVPHMYRDTRGYVTAGIGHLLVNRAEAEKLPWIDASTGRPATHAQIDAEFARVEGMPKAMTAGRYRAADGGLILPPGSAEQLANQRLDKEFLPGLRRLCPDFDSFPPQVQRALVDMAYNLGLGKLGQFRHLIAACNRQDWETAAIESHRKVHADGHGEKRNVWTHDLFMSAAAAPLADVKQ